MILFFPLRFFEATILREREGEHRHECMAVKALPGSSFEVVEPKFLFQLLMGLLANPSCLDSRSQGAQIGRKRARTGRFHSTNKAPVSTDSVRGLRLLQAPFQSFLRREKTLFCGRPGLG